jgi:hypothetical protein
MPTGGTEVVSGGLSRWHDFTEHLERLGDHLGSDPITWDHSEPHPHTSVDQVPGLRMTHPKENSSSGRLPAVDNKL